MVQYNINSSKDAEILKQCQTLKEYSQFIDCIRRHQEHSDNDTAVGRAIDECIDKGILEDFLRANRAEVEAVSVYEFDEKLHEDTIKEIAYSEGYAKGEKSGYAKGEESGYTTGYAKGEESGYINGEIYGRVKAYHELNVSITEIASKVGISADKVTEILNGQL